jgi:hypothetical protein
MESLEVPSWIPPMRWVSISSYLTTSTAWVVDPLGRSLLATRG